MTMSSSMLSIPSRQGVFAYLLILFLAFSSVDNITATTAVTAAETTTTTIEEEEKEQKSISYGTELLLTLDEISSSSSEDEIVSNDDDDVVNNADSSLDSDLDPDNNYSINVNETLATTIAIPDALANQDKEQFTTLEDIVCSSSMSDQFSMLCNLFNETNNLGRSKDISIGSDDTFSPRFSVASASDIDWKINTNDPFTLFAPVNTAFDGQPLEILLPVGLSIDDFLSTHVVNYAISPFELSRNCYANIPTRFDGETTTTICDFDGKNTPIYQVGEGNLFSDRPQFIGTGIKVNNFNGYIYAINSFIRPSQFLATDQPTASPTASPTISPTNSPTESPTSSPTDSPVDSTEPSAVPTGNPTGTPTANPSSSPTASPTVSPSISPSTSPTESPISSPTDSPVDSTEPSAVPTGNPTGTPTVNPSSSPTASPAVSPSISPSTSPTLSPTDSPTDRPTDSPSDSPTASPTASPSGQPSTPIQSQIPSGRVQLQYSSS
ncbi:MAG: hypothetical protein ACI90V_011080 [Bacillariaceae sp.]|jgi:hypothetical protein